MLVGFVGDVFEVRFFGGIWFRNCGNACRERCSPLAILLALNNFIFVQTYRKSKAEGSLLIR